MYCTCLRSFFFSIIWKNWGKMSIFPRRQQQLGNFFFNERKYEFMFVNWNVFQLMRLTLNLYCSFFLCYSCFIHFARVDRAFLNIKNCPQMNFVHMEMMIFTIVFEIKTMKLNGCLYFIPKIFNDFRAIRLWQPFASDCYVFHAFSLACCTYPYSVCLQLKSTVRPVALFHSFSKANDVRTNEQQSGHFMPSFEMLNSV